MSITSEHLAAVGRAMESLIEHAQVEHLASAILDVHLNGGRILVCGNGGSAATAAHLAVDLQKLGLAALALTDSAALTAHGNDDGFDQGFARQVAVLGQPGDALLAISASGNSPNVLRAVEVARRRGLRCLALAGVVNGGGSLCDVVDLAVVVDGLEGRDYGVVEDAHLAICHAVVAAIRVSQQGE